MAAGANTVEFDRARLDGERVLFLLARPLKSENLKIKLSYKARLML